MNIGELELQGVFHQTIRQIYSGIIRSSSDLGLHLGPPVVHLHGADVEIPMNAFDLASAYGSEKIIALKCTVGTKICLYPIPY